MAVAVVLAGLAACKGAAPAGEGGLTFDTLQLQVTTASDTFHLVAEVAQTVEQQALGLMDRTQLDPEAGMLFVYPTPQDSTSTFWMYRTRIPLDIAFWEASGRIAAIQTMEPCVSPNSDLCPHYRAGVEHAGALEVNKGWFERNNVRVGDYIRVLHTPSGRGRGTP